MKLFKICFLALFCLLFCDVQVQAAPKKKKVNPASICGGEHSATFSIVGFKDYPPFSWTQINEKGFQRNRFNQEEYRGFILDFVKETIKELQIGKVRDKMFDDFSQAQKAMLYGRVAFSFLTYYVDEAKSGQDYVYPAYLSNSFIVVSRASKVIEPADLSDLKGLKGVVRSEEEIEPLIRGALPTDTKLEIVNGAENAFRKLLSGEVDFMFTSVYAAEAEARRFKVKELLHFGQKPLRQIKYFISFSKLSPCRIYKEPFTERFKEKIKNKAEVEKQLQKYIMLWVDMHRDDPPLKYEPFENEESKQ